LLVEDLATDGGSKVTFVEALRKADAKVSDVFVVFEYGIFPPARDSLSVMGVKLHSLATWWDVLEAAEKHKYFDAKALEVTRAFLEKPEEWSAAHGGAKPRPPAAPARS
jgi:orotate phosphoribosyltransferase